ncbi:N-Acetylglucosaminyltransferase-IV region [Oesophagostomum dentatum]|uniref:N-Acetylglucosaminyltransferase-IV region n=1 Tax=Oesophagostomum dentatum TaxID=61180 RepID=A0A0B1TM42_OESDE|nr:N-Acetylglucosaminyltransferase-IV region [Oesophagostomum dentatum]
MPVVMRKTNYVMRTLTSLVEKLCPSSRDYVLFVVMFAVPNTDTDEFRNVSDAVLSTFSREIKEGLLEVMVIPPKWYELEFEMLVPTFGDSKERMRWRTKQNLDYFYLMNYARHKAEYYMQLEDDIIATSGYSYVSSI